MQKLPEDIGYDVCGFPKPGWNPMRGLGIPKKFFVTHTDLDHLKAFGEDMLWCAEPLQKRLEHIYHSVPIEIETYPHDLCIPTYHPREIERNKVPTFGYFHKDLIVIPECHDALKLLKEHAMKYAVIVFFKQPRTHAQEYISPSKLQELCDHAYFADVSTMNQYSSHVIPQCVPSIQNVKDDPDLWFLSPFAKLYQTSYKI